MLLKYRWILNNIIKYYDKSFIIFIVKSVIGKNKISNRRDFLCIFRLKFLFG